jgi:hypothetical protein
MERKELEFEQPYGLLLNRENLILHRKWFEEMTRLIGISCLHKAPRKDKHYNEDGELISNYEEPEMTGCIFVEHPDAKTMRKIGWVTELEENASLIHVPYDLKGLQQGSLFIIPDTFDPKKGRVFRVTQMSANLVYPASITCEIVPEWANEFEQSQLTFPTNNFNLLNEEDE